MDDLGQVEDVLAFWCVILSTWCCGTSFKVSDIIFVGDG
jgi:hypothetical protein